MRARHFEHFLSLQSQMSAFRRARRPSERREAGSEDGLAAAVAEAKGWLAATGKRRYKSAA